MAELTGMLTGRGRRHKGETHSVREKNSKTDGEKRDSGENIEGSRRN